MKIALTGATGIAGQAILQSHAAHDVTILGRSPVAGHRYLKWSLDAPAPDLSGFDALIHAAFQHAPGKYRGGEGDDPAGFITSNLDGTVRLFGAAVAHGLSHVIFLSSRAVFDGYPKGTTLTENLPPKPTSLYGEVKAKAEAHLSTLPLTGITLRATGLYGKGNANKWAPLIADYLSGNAIEPRVASEAHVQDLAQACQIALSQNQSSTFHVSDILLDRHDLLAMVQNLTNSPNSPPDRSDADVSQLECTNLKALGWQPGGMELLRQTLPDLLPQT